jgi:hypothetical protein
MASESSRFAKVKNFRYRRCIASHQPLPQKNVSANLKAQYNHLRIVGWG